MSDKCLLCRSVPCDCKCKVCGIPEAISKYPSTSELAIDGVEEVSNLTLDSFVIAGPNIEQRLLNEGWFHKFIDGQHFRQRLTCRECLNKLTESREVWASINKERKAKDTYQPHIDSYYGLLVGAEQDSDTGDSDYYKQFSD